MRENEKRYEDLWSSVSITDHSSTSLLWLATFPLHVYDIETKPMRTTRSTWRAQTSLAEADHYSHIAVKTVKILNLGGEKITPKVLDHYLHHKLVMLLLLWCCFAHLLILEYLDHHQNLISSSLYYPGPLHKNSSQSVHSVLNNVHKQTNRETDKSAFPKT